MRSRMAGQDTLVIFTDHFFGLALSMVTPVIDDAVAVHLPVPAGAQYSLKPCTSWKVDLRTVFADLATPWRPVSQSCAMTGLPSDQFALAFISNEYVRPSLEMVYVAIFGLASPLLASCATIPS